MADIEALARDPRHEEVAHALREYVTDLAELLERVFIEKVEPFPNRAAAAHETSLAGRADAGRLPEVGIEADAHAQGQPVPQEP